MVWKNVVGYEGHYKVSDTGQIMSMKYNKNQIMSTFSNEKGYLRVTLTKHSKIKQVFVHRLVAEAFLGEIPEGYTVNHIDGNKQNNKVSNLEIVTMKENVLHSCYVLRNIIKPVYMLDTTTFKPIKEYKSITLAAKEIGISDSSVYRVCINERNFAGGYSWIFKEDYSQENIDKKIKRLKEGYGRKKVCQIDPETGEIIKIYPGVRKAERELGITTIKHCVSGRTKTAGGYIWKYA